MDFIDYDYVAEKRYDIGRFIGFREDCWDVTQAYIFDAVKELPVVKTYVIRDDPFRPDMISHGMYRDTQYWLLIMHYNDIIDIAELHQGRVLNGFSLDALNEVFFTLKALQIAGSAGV